METQFVLVQLFRLKRVVRVLVEHIYGQDQLPLRVAHNKIQRLQ